MARTKVVVHQPAVAALERSAEVGQSMVDTLEPAAEAARADAPVRTGTYRDALRVEAYEADGKAGARLVADVDYALFVEAEHGVLARSIDAVQGSR